MLGVAEHGLDQGIGVALVTEDRRAVLRVLVERGVDLVVEVVEKRVQLENFFSLPELAE